MSGGPQPQPLARRTGDIKTIAQARRDFVRRRSPRLILGAIAVLAAARVALGGFGWDDVAAAAVLAVIYPFGEWAIHVYLLHMRPFRLRGQSVELPTSRSHREHHERPDRLGLILLGPQEAAALLLGAVPLVVAACAGILALAGGSPRLGPAISAWLAGAVMVAIYEWTHFLIHTAHRPRSRYYRAIWRNHRLHHFKNERYWHGITNTLADRAFGTLREQGDVPRSPTARSLHGSDPSTS